MPPCAASLCACQNSASSPSDFFPLPSTDETSNDRPPFAASLWACQDSINTSSDLLPHPSASQKMQQPCTVPEGCIAPKRRCRNKTSEQQLIIENNIRVAFHSPDPSSQSSTTCPPERKSVAFISQPELVTTSDYVAYHQRMGHSPPNIISVSPQEKRQLLRNNNLPAELKSKRLYVVVDLSIQKKHKKN